MYGDSRKVCLSFQNPDKKKYDKKAFQNALNSFWIEGTKPDMLLLLLLEPIREGYIKIRVR
jgi:hypothetical protein